MGVPLPLINDDQITLSSNHGDLLDINVEMLIIELVTTEAPACPLQLLTDPLL
jgi:hypothetical protein